MNVVFHTAAGIAIGHIAASRMDTDRPPIVYTAAFVLAVVSHGVLDGLKHGYPLSTMTDVISSLVLMGVWILLVAPRYRALFALTFIGALLPDVVDLGPYAARHYLGWHVFEHPHWFPWHWTAGSGSLYGGKDAAISLTNHGIVCSFIVAAIVFFRRGVWRGNEAGARGVLPG